MKKSTIGAIALVAVASVGIALVAMPSVAAYRGDYTKTGPNHTAERETAMEQIMKNKDFAAWKKLMTTDGAAPGVLRKIDTQEEFNKFADAWNLGKQGKTEEAAKLRAELGLGQGGGAGRQGNRGQNNGGKFVDANNDGKCDNL